MEPRVVAADVGFCEGPVWTQAGRLAFVSEDHGCIYEITAEGPRLLAETQGGANGLTEGPDETLYVAQNGGQIGADRLQRGPAEPGIQQVRPGKVDYLVSGLEAPNDICFGPDGRLYFTDPRGPATPENQQPGRIFADDLDGNLQLLAEGPAYPNGLAFDATGEYLYVAETFRLRVLRYAYLDGTLGQPDIFCETGPGFPDGMCFDTDGRLYVGATMAGNVQVYSPGGERIDSLSCGDGSMPTNCCFGGPGGSTLYVTDTMGRRVLAFETEARGLPLYPFR